MTSPIFRARLAGVALVALALLSSSRARGDSLADEADYRFRRATALYQQGRVDDALGEFLFSNRLVHNKNVLFDIARCYEQLKRSNEAFRWYVEILAEPELTPQLRDAVQTALQRLAPSLALLRVESEPAGATVYVGRKDLGARGQTPLSLALPPGNQTVLLELEGHKPAQQIFPLAVGKTLHAELVLEPIVGMLEVSGEPSQFELREGSATGEPLLRERGSIPLVPGSHRLWISAEGFATQELETSVDADETSQLAFKLEKLPPPAGTLVLQANVEGALIKIDGKAAGFSPAVIDAVPIGKHTLTVEAEGREPATQGIEIHRDERTVIDLSLGYALPRVQAAERQLTLTEDAPSSITIITAAEIRGFAWLTLAEALRSVRGMFITDDRGYVSLGVRGYSAPGTYNDRVLVLSDGHITNDLSLGQGFIGQDFDTDLSDVERIEVVRGPGSVLYGSAAFLAVINVVHKTPRAGLHGEVVASALDQSEGSAQVSLGSDTRYLAVRAGAYHAAGETLFTSPVTSGTAVGTAQNLDGESASHASLRARLDDLTLNVSLNDRSKDLPTAPFDTVFGAPGTNLHDTRFFAEAAWAHTFASSGFAADARVSFDDRHHSANLAYQGTDASGNPTNTPLEGSNGRIADWLDGEARLRFPEFFGNHVFIGGEVEDVYRVRFESFLPAGAYAGTGSAPDINYSGQIYSLYAGDDWRISSRVQLDAAIRLDDHGDSFGSTANPRVALLAQPYMAGHFKLIYGTAYRAPSFYERYFTDGDTQVPGNRCDQAGGNCIVLQPETIRTGEFEHTHQFTDTLSFLVAGYWSQIADILRLASTNVPGQFAFGNRSTLTHSSGIEFEARWQPQPGMMVAAWYAWAHQTNDNGFIVPNVPTHTAALRVLVPIFGESLSLASEAIYGSTRYTVYVDAANQETGVGEQLYWNAGVSGQARYGLHYALTVQDLLDEKPLQPAGLEVPFLPKAVPQPGRILRASVGGTF